MSQIFAITDVGESFGFEAASVFVSKISVYFAGEGMYISKMIG